MQNTDQPGFGKSLDQEVVAVSTKEARQALEAAPASSEIREASELLKVVGDLTRMRILCTLLSGEELSVGKLQKALGMSQSAVSHQLRILRDANLVKPLSIQALV